ncbi:hypothetical protein [Taibaiella chishuiensis]|nr:hypothetical protein [Taibaiella chishuiensis]
MNMTHLQQLIETFTTGPNGETRAQLIAKAFGDLEDTDKWSFLLTLIQQQDTDDLVKINIYKLIELEPFSAEMQVTVKDTVLRAIALETDELVRQYAYISLASNFNGFSDVLDQCVAAMENEEEDLDVRYCAWDVIARSADSSLVATYRERLFKVQSFGTSIERLFAVPVSA